MVLPPETHAAFRPRTRKVGNCTLMPLTLAGAIGMDALGVDVPGLVCGGKVALAAWVLAGGDAADHVAFAKFAKRLKAPYALLESAVNDAIEEAFSTHVKAAPADGEPVRLAPHGFGWPLEVAEFLCGEYGWPFEVAAATPVATALGLMAAWSARNRVKLAGFDYLERAYAKKMVGSRGARTLPNGASRHSTVGPARRAGRNETTVGPAPRAGREGNGNG